MDKKKKILIICLSLFLVLSFVVISVKTVDADSGWDFSYDSGSSWDSDYSSNYDYDYDYDYDYSSSGGGNYKMSGFILIIFLVLVIIGIVFKLLFYALKFTNRTLDKVDNSMNKAYMYGEVTDKELEKLSVSREEFENKLFEIYKNIQIAWMEFDYKKLRKYTTDEIYNSYVMQLDALKLKKQKNIVKDFECVNVKIYKIEQINGFINVSVYLNVKMFDFVVDKNEDVVRGLKEEKINIEYELTFVKSSENNCGDTVCPNCGAKVNAIVSGKCEHCGSVIVGKIKDYVLSSKTCIKQRIE